MSNLESEFRLLLQIENVDDLDAEEALNHLARLIDLAFDFKHVEGTMRAIQVGEGIGNRTLSSAQAAILNYYLSNAWANRRQLERTTPAGRVEVGTAGGRKADHPPSPCA